MTSNSFSRVVEGIGNWGKPAMSAEPSPRRIALMISRMQRFSTLFVVSARESKIGKRYLETGSGRRPDLEAIVDEAL